MNVTPAQFYLETPLYTPIQFEDSKQTRSFIETYHTKDFVGYNPLRNHETTFTLQSGVDVNHIALFINITLRCKRDNDDLKFYLFWNKEKKTLMKIGQYPSVADFHLDNVKQYDKLLNKSKLREFTKAIGLAANGVGIGSFVYLRRIFEDLIYEAHDEYSKKNNEIDGFNKKRMTEKIDSLKDFLPEFLVENKELYGILSKGIHELEEEDCLAHFDSVKVGIEMILDEKLEQLNKKRKAEAARLKIQQAASRINPSKSTEG